MTIQDLLRQAPDAKTAESARRLFFSRRWQLLAGDGKWLWGEFKVNGPKPLRSAVDLIHGHFFCTCRSRQRPCAHALSLVMILNNQADRITVNSPTEWVLEYQEKLTNRAAVQVNEAAPASAADLLGNREQLMDEGLSDLETRLIDIIDRGLADTNVLGPEFWHETAARLTDAKLAGLGNRLRLLANKDPQPNEQLRVIADLYLAVRAWQQRSILPPKQAEELYQFCGINLKKDELLTRPGRNDHWLVMGSVEGVEDRLRYRRVWLRGEDSKRYALLLDYAFGEQAFERTWPLTSSWQGVAHYYPGSYPQRAVLPFPSPGGKPYENLLAYDAFAAMLHDYQRALALNPWLPTYPAYLGAVRPVRTRQGFHLLDKEDKSLPIVPNYPNFYQLLATSMGKGIPLFAEFDGNYLRPISLFTGTGFVAV